MAVIGTHMLLYTTEPEALRAMLRDVFGFKHVDAGEGWLIFALPPGEVAVHPGGGWGRSPGDHELFLMCRDVGRAVAELEAKGVEFTAPVADEGWGLATRFRLPGVGEVGLYEPRHPSPLAEFPNGP